MKINKGLIRDLSYIDQQFGSWRDGKNFVIENGNIKSEKGFTSYQILNNVICGVTTLANIIIIFSIKYTDSVYVHSEIGYIKDDVYLSKIELSDLNFNISYPILGEAKFNYLDEIIVAFTDNYNVPRLINITNPPIELNNNISLANLFGSHNVPVFKLNSVISSSGVLQSGTYFVGIQYALQDKSYLHTSRLSNPIIIVKDSMSKLWNNFSSCEPNTTTNKVIDISISNVDISYFYIRPVIVYKTDVGITAHVGNDYLVSTNTIQIIINDISNFEVISFSDVITPNEEYSKVGAITTLNNTLYLANLTKEDDIKYQKFANNISVEWVYEEEVAMDATKNSHKDAVILFDKKTFMPDEVYALYIRFAKKNGAIVTKAFHIPGRPPVEFTDYAPASGDALTIYGQAKKFHLENTALTNGDGTGIMGYWENDNEIYPSDDEYNGAKDYNDGTIVGGVDLRGLNIRHHKFPSINYLMSLAGNSPVEYNGLSSNPNSISFINPVAVSTGEANGWDVYCRFDDVSNDLGTLVYTPDGLGSYTLYTNNTGGALNDFSIQGDIQATLSLPTLNTGGWCNWDFRMMHLSLSIKLVHPAGGFITQWVDNVYSSIGTSNATLSININISSIVIPDGYKLQFDIYADASAILTSIPLLTASFNGTAITIGSGAIISATTTYGKILGIKVSNVYIPKSIKDNCSHYEILYAKRTTANMSVIGNGCLMGATRKNFYSYDILANKLDIPITHLALDYDYVNTKVQGIETEYISMPFCIGGDVVFYAAPSSNRLIKVNGSAIVQYNQLNDEFDNDGRSENLYVDYLDGDLYFLKNTKGVAVGHEDYTPIVGNACSFKADMYNSFYNQELVTIGNLVNISSIVQGTFAQTITMYGGDIVYSYYGISVYEDDTINYVIAPTFNISNSGLRYNDDSNVLTTMFPDYNLLLKSNKFESSDMLGAGIYNYTGVPDIADTASKWYAIATLLTLTEIVDFPELYYFNKADASVNDLVLGLVFNINFSFISVFPYRIHRSLVQGNESLIDSWRTFKVSNYYDSANNKGEIYALETEGNDLLILHSSTLYVVRHKDVLNISNDIAISLGQADIFDNLPTEIIPTDEGFVGCQSRYALSKSIHGLTIVDRQQRKIFLYKDKKVEEISIYFMKEFFLENLEYTDLNGNLSTITFDDGTTVLFDDGSAIITSNTEISSEAHSNVDNPFANKGIIATYDNKYDRIIFTKLHIELVVYEIEGVPQTPVEVDNSFTICYYPVSKRWGFFHDYKPQFYFNTRLNSFAISNNIIYKMNVGATGVYDSVTVNPSQIDLIYSDNSQIDKHFLSVIWSTIVTSSASIPLPTTTFDSILLYNDYRYSKVLPLVLYTYGSTGNIRHTSGGWKFNGFRDLLVTKTIQVLDKNAIRELIISDSSAGSPAWYDKNMFISTYIIFRLLFNNTSGQTIELLDVDVNSKKVIR